MARTTQAEVRAAFDRLCAALGRSTNTWTGNRANVGALALDSNHIYGGYTIEEMMNEAGGVRQPFGYERMPAGEFVRAVRFTLDVLDMDRRARR